MRRALDLSKDYDIELVKKSIPVLEERGFKQLVELLEKTINEDVDIDEYKSVSIALTEKIKALTHGHFGTIFYLPYKNIDPHQFGEVWKLRKECQDLLARIVTVQEYMTDNDK